MTSVTGEEVIATGTGEEHFDASVTGFATHGVGGESGDVGGRLIERPDHAVEVGERRIPQDGIMQRCAQSPSHELRVGMIFGETFGGESGQIGRADGEARVTLRVAEFSTGEVRDGG